MDPNLLVLIVKKALHKASPRLPKLLLRLLKYDIRKISYVLGNYLYLADTLSRAYLANKAGELKEDVVMIYTIQIEEQATTLLTTAYEADPVLMELSDTIMKG